MKSTGSANSGAWRATTRMAPTASRWRRTCKDWPFRGIENERVAKTLSEPYNRKPYDQNPNTRSRSWLLACNWRSCYRPSAQEEYFRRTPSEPGGRTAVEPASLEKNRGGSAGQRMGPAGSRSKGQGIIG